MPLTFSLYESLLTLSKTGSQDDLCLDVQSDSFARG